MGAGEESWSPTSLSDGAGQGQGVCPARRTGEAARQERGRGRPATVSHEVGEQGAGLRGQRSLSLSQPMKQEGRG